MLKKHSSAPRDLYGLNYSQPYFKNLKNFLEAQQTKSAAVLYRRKLKQHQDKVNYTNEIQRLRGELSKNDIRLPIGTRKALQDRVQYLKKLGGHELDKII